MARVNEEARERLAPAFKEVHDLLNQMDTETVSELMADWHPAILGEMLKAVAKAKRERYPGVHPDYDAGVRAVAESIRGQ